MCDGRRFAHYDQAVVRRERIAKRLIELVMCLDKGMDNEEFTATRLEMIGLINEMM